MTRACLMAEVFRTILVAVMFIAALAISSRFVAMTLSDSSLSSELSMSDTSDRSVYAPAAYGMDSQTAVEDDEDMMQSIQHLEQQGRPKVSHTQEMQLQSDDLPNAIPPSIIKAFQRARQKYGSERWQSAGGDSASNPGELTSIKHARHAITQSSSVGTTLQGLEKEAVVLQKELQLKQSIAALEKELGGTDSAHDDGNTAVSNRRKNVDTSARALSDERTDASNAALASHVDFTVARGRRGDDRIQRDQRRENESMDALHAVLLRKLHAEVAGLKGVKDSYASSLDRSDDTAAQADGPTMRSKLSFAAQDRDLRWVRRRQALIRLAALGSQVPECMKPQCLELSGDANTETATQEGGGISLTRIKGIGADNCYYVSILGDIGHKMSVMLEGSDGYKRDWAGYGQVYSGCVDKRPGTIDTLVATDEISGDEQAFQWSS